MLPIVDCCYCCHIHKIAVAFVADYTAVIVMAVVAENDLFHVKTRISGSFT